jgi:hypothetical protein
MRTQEIALEIPFSPYATLLFVRYRESRRDTYMKLTPEAAHAGIVDCPCGRCRLARVAAGYAKMGYAPVGFGRDELGPLERAAAGGLCPPQLPVPLMFETPLKKVGAQKSVPPRPGRPAAPRRTRSRSPGNARRKLRWD